MTTEWNEKKEKKVLRRYRFMLTLRILRVAVIMFFIYWAYMMVVSIGYLHSEKGHKLVAYSQLAIDWTYPGISAEHGLSFAEINSFLTQEAAVPFYRKIGQEKKDVGQLHVRKPLTGFTRSNFEFYQKNDQPDFNFWLPVHPETGEALEANNYPGVWETLDKVHEGTVADLAFSTNEFMTPEELFMLLEDFDVYVEWMPVYMGELDLFTEGWWGGSNSVAVDTWGLTYGREFGIDFLSYSSTNLTIGSIDRNQQLMLDNMKLIYNDDSKFAETLFGTHYFAERIQYLEENGFNVYGAVITGPTKELLRLQELDEIQGVQLGEITFWNW